MRLWHEALIPYLPRQQLLGLHREVCALRGLGRGKKHATVDYVFRHPYGWLAAYHCKVMREMRCRSYHPFEEWWKPWYRGKNLPEIECGTEEDAELYRSVANGGSRKPYIYPEHNAAYLRECLDNLAAKGIHIEMEEPWRSRAM